MEPFDTPTPAFPPLTEAEGMEYEIAEMISGRENYEQTWGQK